MSSRNHYKPLKAYRRIKKPSCRLITKAYRTISCPIRIRTQTGRTRIFSTTIILSGSGPAKIIQLIKLPNTFDNLHKLKESSLYQTSFFKSIPLVNSSSFNAPGAVKRIASSPNFFAASTFLKLSSIKIASSVLTSYRSNKIW